MGRMAPQLHTSQATGPLARRRAASHVRERTGAVGLVFKRMLVGFWAIFFTLVALTNLVDLLGALGTLDWRFLNSGNYEYMRSVVDDYSVGPTVTKLLLVGALAIECVAAVLFWRALRRMRGDGRGLREALTAVCFGTGVWIAFVVMTEFFTSYDIESVFRELMAITIGSALALVLIPDDAGTEPSRA
jgi:hypothetical protein